MCEIQSNVDPFHSPFSLSALGPAPGCLYKTFLPLLTLYPFPKGKVNVEAFILGLVQLV